MSKILITGITGFVGSHLAEYILSLNEGHEIYGLCRWRSNRENLSNVIDKINLLHGDLLDLSSLIRIFQEHKFDYVSHLAAQSLPGNEFIPIFKSDRIDVFTFEELWHCISKHNMIKKIKHNGIDTEIITIKGKQIKALGFFNGMGNWSRITQISRHRYIGNLVNLSQKFGNVIITPNHCVYDNFCKIVTPLSNPILLPIRKINYYHEKLRQKKGKVVYLKLLKTLKIKYNDIISDKKYFGYKNSKSIQRIKCKLKTDKEIEAFLLFSAAYITEGCASHRKQTSTNRNVNKKTVTISNSDRKWLLDINNYVKLFSKNINGRIIVNKSKKHKKFWKINYNLVFYSPILYDIMVAFCGKYCHDKKIPYFLFQCNDELKNKFLMELIKGDGDYVLRKYSFKLSRYTTKSRKLASQLSLLYTFLKKDYVVRENNGYYRFHETDSYQNTQGIKNRKIKKFEYDSYVYDIAVKGCENFAAGIGNIVVHNSYVSTSFSAPIETLETNTIGTAKMLETIRVIDQNPVIHICSSSEVYGQVTEDETPIKETNELRPSSPYAVSKVGEDLIAYQYFLSYKMKTIRSRAFTHEGPRRGEVFFMSAFAKQIAAIELGMQDKVYVGNLDSIRTICDVRDMVRAYWLLIQRCIPGEVYNIGGIESFAVGEILEMLKRQAFIPIKHIVDERLLRLSDVTLQLPCIDKFVAATNWQPEITVKQTCLDTLNYWREELKKNPWKLKSVTK